jgi:hypothetical protein
MPAKQCAHGELIAPAIRLISISSEEISGAGFKGHPNIGHRKASHPQGLFFVSRFRGD